MPSVSDLPITYPKDQAIPEQTKASQALKEIDTRIVELMHTLTALSRKERQLKDRPATQEQSYSPPVFFYMEIVYCPSNSEKGESEIETIRKQKVPIQRQLRLLKEERESLLKKVN